jgi:hypothetical protein
MDKMQKAGAKLIGLGVVCLIGGFAWPLSSAANGSPYIVASYASVFLSPYAIIFGAAGLRYGDRLDAILGPLKSDERRQKVKVFAAIFAIPGLILCGILYWLLSNRGYHII